MALEQMSKVGPEMGYSNGAGIYLVLRRLEEAARHDKDLQRKLLH